jgi:hypothetical protein
VAREIAKEAPAEVVATGTNILGDERGETSQDPNKRTWK